MKFSLIVLFNILTVISCSQQTKKPLLYNQVDNEVLLDTYRQCLIGLNKVTDAVSNDVELEKAVIDFYSTCYLFANDSLFYRYLISKYISRGDHLVHFDTTKINLVSKTNIYETKEYLCQVVKFSCSEVILNKNADTLRKRDMKEALDMLNFIYNGHNLRNSSYFLPRRKYTFKKKLNYIRSRFSDLVFIIQDKKNHQTYAIPFDIRDPHHICQLLGDDMFFGGLNLSTDPNDTLRKTKLEDISIAVYDAIISKTGLDLYQNYGLTRLYHKELNNSPPNNGQKLQYKVKEINQLYDNRNKIIKDILTANAILKSDSLKLLETKTFFYEAANRYDLNSKIKACSILMTIEFAERKYFIEVECLLSQYGWKIKEIHSKEVKNPYCKEYIKSLESK